MFRRSIAAPTNLVASSIAASRVSEEMYQNAYTLSEVSHAFPKTAITARNIRFECRVLLNYWHIEKDRSTGEHRRTALDMQTTMHASVSLLAS